MGPGVRRDDVTASTMPLLLATRCARVVPGTSAPEGAARPSREGAGNAGCPMHPQPRARMVVVSMRTSIHSEVTGIARHSRTQWFYGLLRDLPGDRLFATVASRI